MQTTARVRSALAPAVLALALTAMPAHATQMILQSVDQMTARANMVVRAVPIEGTRSSRWTNPAGTGLIVTTTHFQVLETLAGNVAPGDDIVVEQFGGTVGEISLDVIGMAAYRTDEQVVLFLRRDVDGALRVLDVSAGKFEIVTEAAGRAMLTRRDLAEVGIVGRALPAPLTLDEMRDAVQRAKRGQP